MFLHGHLTLCLIQCMFLNLFPLFVCIMSTVLHVVNVLASPLQIKESLFASNMEHEKVIAKMEQRFFDEKVIRFKLERHWTSCTVCLMSHHITNDLIACTLQGGVVTCLQCGGTLGHIIFCKFVGKCAVKESLKLASIRWRYEQEYDVSLAGFGIIFFISPPENDSFRKDLCFSPDVLFFFVEHEIAEMRGPTGGKFCTIVTIMPNFIMPVQNFGRHTPKKFWGQRHAKFSPISDDFEVRWRISPKRMKVFKIE